MQRLLLLPGAAILLGASPPVEPLKNGSFTTEIEGRNLHYEIHGSGPPLMTVPNAWGLTLQGLRGLYRPLESQRTMVYFDPRGMGGSGPIRDESDLGAVAVRKDFESLRKHLGLARVSAIGWSNGATNLIVLASEIPEVLEAAVFVHGSASFLPGDEKPIIENYPDLVQAFGQFNREMAQSQFSVEEQNRRVKKFDTEVWFPQLFADHEAGKRKLQEVFADAGFSWAHAQYTNREWATYDFKDRLPRIRARSLVIAGRHDVLPPERVREVADGIEGSQFLVFEESGHFSQVEETERFVRAVIDFLRVPTTEARP